ncbi:MAG: hypothetical protein ACFB5Z_12315 [Elainellaceae cyanobacterium]
MWGIFKKKPAAVEPPKSGTVTSISAADSRMRVRFQATEWFALPDGPLTVQPGDLVQITGRFNATTLLVSCIGSSLLNV